MIYMYLQILTFDFLLRIKFNNIEEHMDVLL